MFFATSSTPPNGVIRIFAIFFLLLFSLEFINEFESFLLLFIIKIKLVQNQKKEGKHND